MAWRIKQAASLTRCCCVPCRRLHRAVPANEAPRPPSGSPWLHEIKQEGQRKIDLGRLLADAGPGLLFNGWIDGGDFARRLARRRARECGGKAKWHRRIRPQGE